MRDLVPALGTLRISPAEAHLAVRLSLRRGRPHDMPIDAADTVVGHVLKWADRTPEALAITGASGDITYGDLARRVAAVCVHLTQSGLRQGGAAVVAGPRSADSVITFLALESLGIVYVPLDANWPSDRMTDVIRRSGADHLISYHRDASAQELARATARAADVTGVPLVKLPDAGDLIRTEKPSGLRTRCEDPTEPRYAFFTSGTTGTPKGALMEHQGMLNHLWAKVVDLQLEQRDAVALTAPLTFDIAIWQMTAPLLVGGRISVFDDQDLAFPRSLARRLREQEVTVVELVPTVLEWLVKAAGVKGAESLRLVRRIVSTGEELTPQLAEQLLAKLPQAQVVNAYGFTETSDDVTHHVVGVADLAAARLPVGSPVIDSVLYVLVALDGQEHGWRAARHGESGELFVGGLPPGIGYLGDAPATEAAFFHDVFDPHSPTGRLYRSGDGVIVENGCVRYLGRLDRQVKVAGVRMELGEIEAALRRHAAVADCAVVAVADRTRGTGKELVGHLVLREDPPPVEELHAYLLATLPSAMVPRHWRTHTALPVTGNGKTDHRSLARLSEAR
ncbi:MULTISPECIES: AMP-binding protein [unclassified Streptomyces]|uniref:AMP-binding protein n=1 Tax=unclassified Streptomyces TaxID=2593676 RepID=UPI0036EEB641